MRGGILNSFKQCIFPTEAHESRFRRCLNRTELVAKCIPDGIAVRPKYIGSFADTAPHRNSFVYVLTQYGLGNCKVTESAVRALAANPDLYVEFHFDWYDGTEEGI